MEAGIITITVMEIGVIDTIQGVNNKCGNTSNSDDRTSIFVFEGEVNALAMIR